MSQKIRFYLDEHVSKTVVNGLRLRGIDVLRTQEADMLGASDEKHLGFATREARVIFTQDVDFLRLHAKGINHSGIVYTHQKTAVAAIIRGLILIYQVLEADEMKNRVEFL